MALDVETVVQLIRKAFQKRDEERAFMIYASVYPNFTKNNFKKFEDFYKPIHQENISTRSADEIMAEAQEILRKVGEKRGTV